jgi:hypothetical protein
MSFESTLPHKCNFVIFGSKQEEVEAFTVKETAELINIRVDIERHYWEAIINGDTKRAL